MVRKENHTMRLELASVSTSDRRVETIARENLGLVKPGETVYEFVDAGKLAGRRTFPPTGK